MSKMFTEEECDKRVQEQFSRSMILVDEQRERIEELERLLEIAPSPLSVLRRVDELVGENKSLHNRLVEMSEVQEVFCEWMGEGEKSHRELMENMAKEIKRLQGVVSDLDREKGRIESRAISLLDEVLTFWPRLPDNHTKERANIETDILTRIAEIVHTKGKL